MEDLNLLSLRRRREWKGEGEGSVQRSNDAMASSSSARDECRDAIIAYVHKVSESRRNKRNTMDYSTMVLQTSSDTQLPHADILEDQEKAFG